MCPVPSIHLVDYSRFTYLPSQYASLITAWIDWVWEALTVILFLCLGSNQHRLNHCAVSLSSAVEPVVRAPAGSFDPTTRVAYYMHGA